MKRLLSLGLLIAAPLAYWGPALATAPSDAQRYVRFRAADAAGDMGSASSEMQALLAADPASPTLALRAYRQGIVSGDHDLAVNAAKLLDKAGQLPADAPILFAIDAIRAKDWAGARVQTKRLASGKLYTFLAPLLDAWIAQGAGDASPLQIVETVRTTAGLGGAYYSATRALLLLAGGDLDTGIDVIKAQQQFGPRMRLIGAAELAHANRHADALALLTGDDEPVVRARALLERDHKLDMRVDTPAVGVSELLAQVALDFSRQRLLPVATTLARFATFADPHNSTAWITTGNLLALGKKPDAAAAAIDHVPSSDPFAESAQALRFSLLIDQDKKDAALAALARDTKANPDDASVWERAGDTYLALNQPADAGRAYTRALALTDPQAKDALWPRYLQQGTALEQAGDWPAARIALEKAAALAPDQPVVLNHLGYSLLSRREELPRAVKLIDTASRMKPDDVAITDSLGWAHFVTGDTAGALPLLEHAAVSDPGEPTINEHLGDVYWATGRRVEARYAWRAALITAEDKDKARLNAKLADGWTQATASP